MHQFERHELIVRSARETDRVEVSTLAHQLDVTPETVRRDLTQLERKGVIRRVHGGAVAVERLGFEPALDVRSRHRAAEKSRIGEAALTFVPEAGSVFLDAGTTTAALAERLPRDRELNVLTNSIPIAATLVRRADLSLHVLGGRVRPQTDAAIGTWCLEGLADIHVDVAFMGTNGLSVTTGLTTPDQAESAVKRSAAAAAGFVVVLADSSKIGATHFARFATLRDIDVVVTDSGLDDETADEIRAAGPEVVLA